MRHSPSGQELFFIYFFIFIFLNHSLSGTAVYGAMSSNNPSSYPSLTSSWTPASSCVTSTGFWYVVYATNVVFSDMFGMPSVTNIGQGSTPKGGCVPPSYTLGIPYLTDGGCPTHYFAACSTGTFYADHSADYIWCCPSVEGWHFNCAPATDPGAAPYGCQATFDSGDIITGSRTDLVEHTGQAETHTVGDDHGVNAWGIAILSVCRNVYQIAEE
jgi:hypothetical protein